MQELLQKDEQAAAEPSLVITAKESFFCFVHRNASDLISFRFAILSFVYNTLRRRYRRSFFGFAWSLLNPLLTMLVMTVVFSLLFRVDPHKYGIYIFTGSLPWSFIIDSVNGGCESIIAAEGFHKKVFLPKMFFPFVTVCTETINFVFSLISLLILFLLIGMPLNPTMFFLPVAVLLLSTFNLGMALMCAVWTVYFRDFAHIAKVLLGIFFYLTPIIYPLSALPEHYREYFKLNPVYHFVNLFRLLVVDGRSPSYVEWSIPAILALSVAAFGFLILRSKERDLIYRL